MQECLVASLRFDTSMDRTHKDNEFILFKITTESGEETLRYLGLAYVSGTSAAGHLEAIKEGTKDTIGFQSVLKLQNIFPPMGKIKCCSAWGNLEID